MSGILCNVESSVITAQAGTLYSTRTTEGSGRTGTNTPNKLIKLNFHVRTSAAPLTHRLGLARSKLKANGECLKFAGDGAIALPDFTVHKASDLGWDERLLFERWLGRELSPDETISVNAWRPHLPPAGNQLETLPDMAPDEIEALLEAAQAAARGPRA